VTVKCDCIEDTVIADCKTVMCCYRGER